MPASRGRNRNWNRSPAVPGPPAFDEVARALDALIEATRVLGVTDVVMQRAIDEARRAGRRTTKDLEAIRADVEALVGLVNDQAIGLRQKLAELEAKSLG